MSSRAGDGQRPQQAGRRADAGTTSVFSTRPRRLDRPVGEVNGRRTNARPPTMTAVAVRVAPRLASGPPGVVLRGWVTAAQSGPGRSAAGPSRFPSTPRDAAMATDPGPPDGGPRRPSPDAPAVE